MNSAAVWAANSSIDNSGERGQVHKMLRPEQILNAKFTPISKGTYSAEEVDSFLKTVGDSYESLIAEKNELIKKISILADKIESYRNDEEAIKLSLLDAHRMAETINKNAKINADNLIGDAETRSKIIVDGANRQSAQMIDEAKEKAKEIVDNARTAVASLTDRAQKETEAAITSAQEKAAEIIAAAEEEGKKIIGNSKESYEFYSAELERIQGETSKFKSSVEELCKGQLNLLGGIPESFLSVIASVPAVEKETEIIEESSEEDPVVEAVTEPQPEAEPVVFEEQEETDETVDDEQVIYDPEETETEAETEASDEIIEEAPVVEAAEDEELDDLFSFIDEIKFDDVASPDEIPASLDELVVSAEDAVEIEEDEEDSEDDDDFDGFKIDLDSLGIDDSDSDDDDDDIASLFDSMFDD